MYYIGTIALILILCGPSDYRGVPLLIITPMELKLFVPNGYDKRMSVNLCKGFVSASLIFKSFRGNIERKTTGGVIPSKRPTLAFLLYEGK